jgi:hypothetical protein
MNANKSLILFIRVHRCSSVAIFLHSLRGRLTDTPNSPALEEELHGKLQFNSNSKTSGSRMLANMAEAQASLKVVLQWDAMDHRRAATRAPSQPRLPPSVA